MKTKMTREMLRALISPELISEISVLPIKPFKKGNMAFDKEYMWKTLILQTVRPFYRYQIKTLKEYRYLLTEKEKMIADDYKDLMDLWDNVWLFTEKYSFPPQPKAFVNMLK